VHTIALSLRRVRGERAAAAGFALLVFATALCFTLAPRLAERVADGGLHSELAAAPSSDRNLTIIESVRGTFAVRPDAPRLGDVSDVRAAGAGLEGSFPPQVGTLVEDRRFVVDSTVWEVTGGTSQASLLVLRVQEGIEDRVHLVAGRMPTGKVVLAPDLRPEAPLGAHAAVYEAIVPATAAAEMGVGIGASLPLVLSHQDPLNGGRTAAAGVTVVGTYAVDDPGDPFWLDDSTVFGFKRVGNDLQFVQATAIVSADAYKTMAANTLGAGLTMRYQWRFYLDADRIDAAHLDDTVSALRHMESAPPRTGISKVLSDTTLRSGLLRLLVAHQESWRSVDAVLAVTWLGVAALAVATLLVVAVLASAGRRRVAWLLRARGASGIQLLVATGAEGLLLSLPAVGVAVALALALVPGATPLLTLLPAAVVAGVATLVLVAVVGALPAGAASEPGRATRGVRRTSPRRTVAEVALVAVAVGGAFLLRERSVSGASSAGQLGGADPLIAAVPALVGLAAGVVAARIYPLPARLIGALAARRRDIVPVLAVRRAVRGRDAAPVLLILVATATIGAFASVTVAHLDHGADLAAWQQVGAAYRLDAAGSGLPADLDPAALPGVEAAATASLASLQTNKGRIELLAVDAAGLWAVLGGTGAEPDFPTEMFVAPTAGSTSEPAAEALPAIVWDGFGVAPGQTFKATIVGRVIPIRVAATRATFPGLPAGQAFMVLARDQLGAVVPDQTRRVTIAFLRAPPSAAAGIGVAIEALGPGVTLTSQTEAADAVRSSPVVGAVRAGVFAAALAAALFAALAVAAALALAGAAQRAELAHLRVFGLTRRQAIWLTFVEHGPAALVAYVFGVALGLGLFVFLLPGLGLAAVIGSAVIVPLTIEPLHLGLLLAAVLAMVVTGWALGVVAQSDTDPATAVRGGIS
jgi:putative ABC transport system permease protein